MKTALSVLLYATEACPLLSSDVASTSFARVLMKSVPICAVVNDCQTFFNFLPITCQIDIRTAKFLQKFIAAYLVSKLK